MSIKGPAKFNFAQIPTLRDVSPEVVAIEKDIARASARLAELEAERVVLLKEAAAVDASSAAKRQKSRDDAVLATVFGLPASEATSLSEDHSRVVEQIRVLNKLMGELHKRLAVAEAEASVLICKPLADVHDGLAREMATGLLAVQQACVQYMAFTNALNSRGVAWSHMTPAFPRFLGAPLDNYSPLAWYLRECVDAGRLSRDELPEQIRFG